MEEKKTNLFYDEIEKMRRDDPHSPTGKESDRSLSRRIGVSHRNIKLYRDGQTPDIPTLRKIAGNIGLSEKDFLYLIYAAEGKTQEDVRSNDVPIYLQNETKYINSNFIGEPIRYLSHMAFNKPQSVVRAAFRGLQVNRNCRFVKAWDDADVVFIFNINKIELIPNKTYVFHDQDGKMFLRKVIVRGRQIWLSDGDEDSAEKINLDKFNETVVGLVLFQWTEFGD